MKSTAYSALTALVGALLVVGLLVLAVPDAIQSVSNAKSPMLTQTLSLAGPGIRPTPTMELVNSGNVTASPVPMEIPVANVSGVVLPLGMGAPGGSVIGVSGGLTAVLPEGNLSAMCQSSLSFSSTHHTNFTDVIGGSAFGPTTFAVVFAGLPQDHLVPRGVLIASMHTLVLVSPSTSGNGTATVVYDDYTSSVGAMVAQSPPFPLNTSQAVLLTLSIDTAAVLSVEVNDQTQLAHDIVFISPAPATIAVWTNSNNTTAVSAMWLNANGGTKYMIPSNSCGAFFVLPITSAETPKLQLPYGTARLLPVPENSTPNDTPVYLLVVALPENPSLPSITCADAQQLSVAVGTTLIV